LPDGSHVPVTLAPAKPSPLPPPAKAATSHPITITSGKWDGWPNDDFHQQTWEILI